MYLSRNRSRYIYVNNKYTCIIYIDTTYTDNSELIITFEAPQTGHNHVYIYICTCIHAYSYRSLSE